MKPSPFSRWVPVVVVAMFCILASDTTALAQAGGLPGLYTIDYKLVLALHPLMANYDMVLGRHIRSDRAFHAPRGLDELNNRVNQLNANAQPKLKSLQKHIDQLALERSKVTQRMLSTGGEVNSARGTLGIEQTNKAQRGKIGDLDQQIAEAQAQLQAAQDEVLDPIYFTRTQSNERIRQALNEIDAQLTNFSAQRGGAMIIDRDFVKAPPAHGQQVMSAPTVGADPLSVSLFQKLLTGDLMVKVPDAYLKDPELQRYANQMRSQMSESFDRNVSAHVSKTPLLAATPGSGRLFLVGGEGVDLTRTVLTEIYRQHNIRTDVAQRILSLIKID